MIKTIKRKGIILAAGLGSRMCNENADTSCKPLMLVDNISLLIQTIHSLEIAACEHVIIVLGHQAEIIKNYICCEYDGKVPLEFVINHKYNLQNGISVLSARPHISGEFILTMADHILDDQIMHKIRDHHPPAGGAALCVDFKLETIFDIDDATKVRSNGSYVKKIGKNLIEYNCIDTGVFVATEGLFAAIDQVFNEKGDATLSEGVQLLADKDIMMTLDIKDAYWQDVDTPEMLAHAKKLLAMNSNKKRLHSNELYLR